MTADQTWKSLQEPVEKSCSNCFYKSKSEAVCLNSPDKYRSCLLMSIRTFVNWKWNQKTK